MDVGYILRHATARFKLAGIATARLDCLVLLEDVLNTNRTHLLAHPEIKLTTEQQDVVENWVQRRCHHEPLAYIRCKSEFYGRDFYVDRRVLEPRPESETIIELLKQIVVQPGASLAIVDVGTGSGALAITAKLEFPRAIVTAMDIDPECLDIARRNALQLGADVNFLCGNLLNKLHKIHDDLLIILANLPYVPDSFPINEAAMHEPRRAIFGGPDGLELYRQFFQQLAQKNYHRNVVVLAESMPAQHSALSAIANMHGYEEVGSLDFIQVFRRGIGSSAL